MADIEVLKWWYGFSGSLEENGSRIGFVATAPAFSVNDGSFVPLATVYVWSQGTTVTIVRTVDVELGGFVEFLELLRGASEDELDQLRASGPSVQPESCVSATCFM